MSTNYAFGPEAVEALAAAFDKSWSFISNDPHFATQDPALLQRCLAKCLMQLAAEGEQDPLQLANGGIGRMRLAHGLKAALSPPRTGVARLPIFAVRPVPHRSHRR
jgi:hypothetical protein